MQLASYPQIATLANLDLFPLTQASSASTKNVTFANLVAGVTASITTGTGLASAQSKFVISQTDVNLPNAQPLGNLGTGLLKVTTISGTLSTAIAGTDYAIPGSYITGLTGDVTAAGPGSAVATIAALAVTNAKIANSTIDLTAKVTGILPAANGGTGVANASTLTMGGNVTFTGAFTTAITVTAGTAVTLPTAGTLATLAGVETLTNKTLTSPKIGTSILDTGGNILLAFTATGSAVNYLTYANAAAGSSATFTPTGASTDIGVNWTMKGAGIFTLTNTNAGGNPLLVLNNTTGDPVLTFQLAGVTKALQGVASAGNEIITGSSVGDFGFRNAASASVIFSTDNGTSIHLKLTAANASAIFNSSVLSKTAAGGVGYTTGAGGTISQGTSKATAFTLSKVTGQITTFNDNLAAGAIVSATWTNTSIAATDVVAINHVSGGTIGAYSFNVQCGAGTATLNIRNNTAGGLAEALVLQFVVIKGVTA